MKPPTLLAAIAVLPLLGAGAPGSTGGPQVQVISVSVSQYIRCITPAYDIRLAIPVGMARRNATGQYANLELEFTYQSGGATQTTTVNSAFWGYPVEDGANGRPLYDHPICVAFFPDNGTIPTVTATLTP